MAGRVGKDQLSAGLVPLLAGVNFCFLRKSVKACLTWEVQLSLSHVTSLLVLYDKQCWASSDLNVTSLGTPQNLKEKAMVIQ